MDPKTRIISILANFGNNAAGKEELDAWMESDSCIDIAVEIIQETENVDIIFLASTALRIKLTATIQEINDAHIDSLFVFFIEQIMSGKELGKGFTQILRCAAIIAVAKTDYMEQVLSLPPNFLVLFFQFCIEISEKDDKIITLIPVFFEILEAADMSPDWLRFHSSVIGYVPFSQCQALFPRIVEAAANRELHNSIYLTFEVVLNVDFDPSVPEDIVYIDNIIELMMSIAESILAGECALTDYQFVSVIYRTIIDYGPDYFAYENHTELISNFFDIFLSVLHRFMLEGLERELIFLLEYAGEFINYAIHVDKENPKFVHFQIEIMKFMIGLIDSGQERFLVPTLESIFKLIAPDKQKEINQFFTESLNDPTPGVFYALAYLKKNCRVFHASHAAHVLIGMPQTPFTVVYFTRTCGKLAEESITLLIQLVYQFVEQMPLEVAKTISVVANRFYMKFIENSEELINPILEMIDASQPDFTAELISALFSIFTRFSVTDPRIETVFGEIAATIFGTISAQIEEDDVSKFIEFLLTIIKGVPEKLNADFYQFFYKIYDEIHPHFEELWGNSEYAEQFADLIGYCITRHWANPETYIEFYVHWLQELFPENALPQHFNVLLCCVEYVDISIVTEILQSVNDSDNQMLKTASFDFCLGMVAKVHELLPIAMEQIFFGMSSTDNQLPHKAIKSLLVIENIAEIDLSKFVGNIVQLVIPIFLKNATDKEILDCCTVLYLLEKYSTPEELAGAVVEAAGMSEEAQRFGEKFAARATPENCLNEAFEMVGAFRNTRPAEPA